MIYSTMQLVISYSDNPSLVWMFKTNDRMLWYNHVTYDIFIDTLFSENASNNKRQFTWAQVFVTDFGYTRIFPMKSNEYDHPIINHFFDNVGFPPALISNFVEDQFQGESRIICEQAGCHIW